MRDRPARRPPRIARRNLRIGCAGLAVALTVGAARTPEPGLDCPPAKEVAMELVASAENSTLDWRSQYQYIEDIGDGQGYTGGIIGFCSGTGDMLDVVTLYTRNRPANPLAAFLPALRKVNGTSSHAGLGDPFVKAWKTAATDKAFQEAQEEERDHVYFDPSVRRAKADGLRTLGQFIYFDATVMHGGGDDRNGFGSIRKNAMAKAKPPALGGDEAAYLNAFLDARKAAIKRATVHGDTSRVDTEQRVFLNERNFTLQPPLRWKTYGDPYEIRNWPSPENRHAT
ncbi:chitosanase [Streptomyces abikoensis]|uniref:chitosanase n=1 Tax=Streptomyces abikoensis TaxID=97398 RepID=UPI00368AF9B1